MPNAKGLSRLGPRGTFGMALNSVASDDPRVVGLVADLAITAGMDRFRKDHPDRFVNVGIAEQNLVGIAAGLADDGFVPFAVTFANFAALRSCELVRHHMGYMRQNIKLVGIGAGFAMGQFGTTHYSIEDVGALRSIPNLTIITPADCGELVEAVEAVSVNRGPVYLRLNGAVSMPVVDQTGTQFRLGGARRLQSGGDVTFVAAGSMVARCIQAAAILEEQGMDVGVANFHTIKPLDTTTLAELSAGTSLIVTAEEHSVIGGLGSAVAEYLTTVLDSPPVLRIGVPDSFPKVGNYDWVMSQCGLDAPDIADRVASHLAGRELQAI